MVTFTACKIRLACLLRAEVEGASEEKNVGKCRDTERETAYLTGQSSNTSDSVVSVENASDLLGV